MGSHQRVIAGVVRDAGGRPIPGARVLFREGPVALPDTAALADQSGAFSLAAPAPGTYVVVAAADGFSSAVETVKVGEKSVENVVLRLRP